MGKIKIHKSSIKMFDDFDVLVAYVKDYEMFGHIQKWFLAYREQDNPDRIGAHVYYSIEEDYFNHNSDYNVKYKKWNESNLLYFEKNEIADLRLATDEERSEFYFILKLQYNCSLSEERKEIINKYTEMIYGQD